MKTATTKTTLIQQQSLNVDDYTIQQQSLNSDNAANSLSDTSFNTLDDVELELESIMFEELGKGLPSDIPMAGF